jgi:hypothetical protein
VKAHFFICLLNLCVYCVFCLIHVTEPVVTTAIIHIKTGSTKLVSRIYKKLVMSQRTCAKSSKRVHILATIRQSIKGIQTKHRKLSSGQHAGEGKDCFDLSTLEKWSILKCSIILSS